MQPFTTRKFLAFAYIQRDCNNFLGAKKHAINNKLITPSTLSLYICVECFE